MEVQQAEFVANIQLVNFTCQPHSFDRKRKISGLGSYREVPRGNSQDHYPFLPMKDARDQIATAASCETIAAFCRFVDIAM